MDGFSKSRTSKIDLRFVGGDPEEGVGTASEVEEEAGSDVIERDVADIFVDFLVFFLPVKRFPGVVWTTDLFDFLLDD